ncbi:MAG TPA: hypothetical protein VGL58_19665 [Caulobacteraceae bacterium]|jgi:DNA-binding GntR family transcriptional regulator
MQDDDDVRLIDFIRGSIRTVWGLELLLLLRRPPLRMWSQTELVAELRASETVLRGALGRFEAEGLVTRHGGDRYRFEPASFCLDQLCDSLAATYRERPVAVIQAIAVSDDQVEALAAAFKLRDDRR